MLNGEWVQVEAEVLREAVALYENNDDYKNCGKSWLCKSHCSFYKKIC